MTARPRSIRGRIRVRPFRIVCLAFAILTVVPAADGAPVAAQREATSLPPNGRIVFSQTRLVHGSLRTEILTMEANGTGTMRLAREPRSDAYLQAIRHSPDGTQTVYLSTARSGQVIVVNIDGSGGHLLGPEEADWYWGGDTAARIIEGKLYTMPVGGGDLQLVSGDLTKLETYPIWSPDHTRLAFGARDPSTDEDGLYIAAADGSSLDRIQVDDGEPGPCGDCWAGEDRLDWSPDGSTIAYSYNDDLWTVHPDGTGLTRLLFTRDFGDLVEWSPTGEQLMFLADALDSPGSLGVVDADGQNEHYIPGAWAWEARWSPDGTMIVYEGAEIDGDDEIYTAPAAGGPPSQLTDNPYSDGDPIWVPGCSITGTPEADVLVGTPERDYICGGAGDDVISALGGDDVLLGGGGADILRGGAGNDVVAGERGADQLRGGSGDDTVNGRDGGTGERLTAGHGNDRCRKDRGDIPVSCETIDRDL
jgi:dipeptidyl aminopeptidase/acylaminoacyl peptidase